MDGIPPFIYGGRGFSSPFLGTFFQFDALNEKMNTILFSSPFLGTFFQFSKERVNIMKVRDVFVPFLGDFLSIREIVAVSDKCATGFRPLSWGLSFNLRRSRTL